MKKTILFLLGITLALAGFAQGVKAGPWVSEARTDRLTVVWTSEKPGMA